MDYPKSFAACRAARFTAWLAIGVLAPASGAVAQADSAKLDNWIKICVQDAEKKKSLCRTGYDVVSDDGRILIQAVLSESTVQKERTLTLSIPTGVQLQPGLKIQVDGGKAQTAVYGFCNNATCVAQAVIDDQFLAAMKAGSSLSLTATGQSETPVAYALPLTTFKSAYEGPALDALAAKARNEELARRAQAKQRSQFERLVEEQRKARGE